MITKLVRRALRDTEPWTYTLWASELTQKVYAELTVVATWTRWALSVDVEVDEYGSWDYARSVHALKRRWWLSLQVGPWSLVYSRERRVS